MVSFPIKTAIQVIAHLGPRWALFRLRYAAERLSGVHKLRTPQIQWADTPAPPLRLLRCFRAPASVGTDCLREANDIVLGHFRLFSFHKVDAGLAPTWNTNPFSRQTVPATTHWADLGDFDFGDIKAIWELSRFQWAFTLARAYTATSDERFAERFWTLFQQWMRSNTPNSGPNWMCGQEAAFRLFAATFAHEIFEHSAATTVDRERDFGRFTYVTAMRIESNLEYALSQANNHGISECVGLITASALLPSIPDAKRWHEKGMTFLEDQVDALVYNDGGFSQHSAIYHRVLLHDLYWVTTVLRAASYEVPKWLISTLQRALDFATELADSNTGIAAVYGANDGANILPLADADFLDFRPSIQAGSALLYGTRPCGSGPWDEMADWLCGSSEPLIRPRAARNWEKPTSYFPNAGCFIWRNGQTRLFLRCPTRFVHRPSQADLQHVSVFWRHLRIAHDAGTYSYNTAGRFRHAFKGAATHNSITIDGQEPMRKAGRFLLLPWPKGYAHWTVPEAEFTAGHDAWKRLGVQHRRSIRALNDASFIVRDELSSAGHHSIRIQWLLADHPYSMESNAVVLHTPEGNFCLRWSVPCPTVSIVRADEHSDRGWWSPYYLYIEPALSLMLEYELSGDFCIENIFQPVN